MAVQVATRIGDVTGFGYLGDEHSKRLVFPRVESHDLAGRSGSVRYGVADILMEKLDGRLDVTRWAAEAASLGHAWLQDDAGKVVAAIDRIEMPNGMMIARGERGVEILSPHLTLSDVKLTVKGFATPKPAAAPAAPAPAEPKQQRQQRVQFLDSLAGHVDVTVKVKLHLPVIGTRTLDQDLAVPIQDGCLDYRALEEQINWLEGRFLDIVHDDNQLAVTWKVPIFGSQHELITWPLDPEATTLASFGKVPVRALADYKLASSKAKDDDDDKKGEGLLRAFALESIDVALSLLAPRNLEVGGGMIAFGGDGQPGMLDLKVTGKIADHGEGELHGAIGRLDTTIKDLRLGGAVVSADRLSIDGIDALEVTFDGFRPVSATMIVHRVTATNLVVKLGS